MGVANFDGALYFASGIDNSGLYRDAEEAKRYIKSIEDYAKTAGIAIGAVFGVNSLAQFGREIIKVRGEMQMLESSFETLLGGRQGSSKLIADIKEYAIESPLSLTGISNAAQMMLGFNIEAEKTIPIIKQIGDISMGNEQRLQSLALAFSQMHSTGKLMGQDLMQMINAGFNPLNEISRKTGKSISDLKKEMESGAISSQMVADAFRTATEEGGKFYGMTKKQAEGIKGAQAQLAGSIQDVFNELGENSEKFVTGVYRNTKTLVDNYETVGRLLTSLIATYGVYKAAVITVTIAEKGWTIASMAQYRWLLLVEKAQKLLNATMLKNPYVLAATAVIGLVSVLITFKDRTTAAEKAQKRVNEVLEEAKNKKDALKSKGSELISILNDETQTVYQQIKAYRELLSLLPKLQGKSLKDLQKMNPDDIAKLLNEKADEDFKSNIQKQHDGALKSIENYERVIKRLKSELTGDSTADRGKNATIGSLQKQMHVAKLAAEDLKKQLADIADTEKQAKFLSMPADEQKKELESQKAGLLEYKNQLERIYGNNPLTMSVETADTFNRINDEINKLNAGIESYNETAISKNKTYWEEVKKTAEDARAAMATDEKGSKEWNRLTSEIANANKELEKYSDKAGTSKDTSGTGREISKSILDSELALSKARLDILQDGKDKRLKLSEQEYKERIAQIDRDEADLLEKYKKQGEKSIPDDVKKTFDDRRQTEGKAKETRDKDIEKTYDEELVNRSKELTNVLLGEEEKRKAAIKQRYDDERKWAKEQLESKSITQGEHDKHVSTANEAEVFEQQRRILTSLNDFKQQEKEIREKWDSLIADATEAGDADLLGRLQKGKQKALSELNAQMLMQSEEWLRLFQNLDTLTTEELSSLIGNVQSQIDSGALDLSPVDLQALMDKLEQAKEKMSKKQPFTELAKSIDEYKSALTALREAETSGLTGAALDSYRQKVLSAAAAVKRNISSIKDVYGQMSEVMRGVADLVGMVDEGLGETVNNALDLGDAVINIGEVVSSAVTSFAAGMNAMETASVILLVIKAVIMAVMAAIKLFDKDKTHKKKIKEYEESVKDLEYAYQQLDKAIQKAFSTDKVKLIEQQNQNLKQQNRELLKAIEQENQRGKKKDENANKERRRQIEENNAKIAENTKEKITEALTGKDVMTAIDDFVSAYTDAWTKNEDATRKSSDTIKNTIKRGLTEWLKKELSSDVKHIQNRLADFLADGIISEAEQAELDRLQAELDRKAEEKRRHTNIDKYLEDAEKTGVTGELKKEMTEGTASQLLGLWNMTAMDIREIKEWAKASGFTNIEKELNGLLNELYAINKNTRETADNTEYLEAGLKNMEEKLDEIKKNTKPNNSRR